MRPFVPSLTLAQRFADEVASELDAVPPLDLLRRGIAERLEGYVATLARRTAMRGGALQLASERGFGDDVAEGLRMRLGLASSRSEALAGLAQEYRRWLVEECKGNAGFPWGIVRASGEGLVVESAPIEERASEWTRATVLERGASQARTLTAGLRQLQVQQAAFEARLKAFAEEAESVSEAIEAKPKSENIEVPSAPHTPKRGLAKE